MRAIGALADRDLMSADARQLFGAAVASRRVFLNEASALLPPRPPDYLRLRMLMSSAYVKNRGGHYDEAMLRYNQALKLVDETGPIIVCDTDPQNPSCISDRQSSPTKVSQTMSCQTASRRSGAEERVSSTTVTMGSP